ncbi:MAG: hypothetical protein M9962_08010 [Oligoflexia bacterium]|nr:hypothetical protein [Oligoflexia bacterium]
MIRYLYFIFLLLPNFSFAIEAEFKNLSKKYDLHQPILIHFKVKEAPKGSSYSLSLELEKENYQLSILRGPLQIVSEPIEGEEVTFQWDGKKIACAPTDAPDFCTGIDPANYQFELKVYSAPKVPIVGDFRVSEPREPIYKVRSSTFSLEGGLNLEKFVTRARSQVVIRLHESFKFSQQFTRSFFDRYVDPYQVLSQTKNKTCIKWKARTPFTGEIVVCEKLIGDTELGFNLQYLPNVSIYNSAYEKAHGLLLSKYKNKARAKLGTEISSTLTNAIYKCSGCSAWNIDKAYWGFEFWVQEVGGNDPMPDRFSSPVFVKVQENGKVEFQELPKVSPNSSSSSVDIWKID